MPYIYYAFLSSLFITLVTLTITTTATITKKAIINVAGATFDV